MLRSMTGFGRCLVENAICSQQWEIRSVNSRFLDIKWRLPPVARYLEPNFEKLARGKAGRGRVEISLSLRFAAEAAPKPFFDARQAGSRLDSLEALAKKRGEPFTPDYSSLLAVEALWSEPELDQDQDLTAQLEGGLVLALDDWNEARAAEGAALGADLGSRILRLEEWAEIIGERAPAVKEERLESVRQRVADVLAANGLELEESRFLQEIAQMTDRLDVSEEITRLETHLERMRQLLEQGMDAGRRLDFTLQECFREINTCGNKLADAQLSRIVVDFKNELEKCREQAQNLE